MLIAFFIWYFLGLLACFLIVVVIDHRITVSDLIFYLLVSLFGLILFLIVLEGIFETPIVRYELSLTAIALPRVRLVGRIRSVDDRSKSKDIEVENDDIVLLARKKSLLCLIE
jgi:hypothetical protein